jgi:hypothetical protein
MSNFVSKGVGSVEAYGDGGFLLYVGESNENLKY